MGVLPVGTVTLLLADIEGSTRLWEQRADEMPAAIATLDDVVNTVVAEHNGVRPVEQGEGDSFVVAFALASDAVACAVALQRATAQGLLRLRIGVNTGEVQLRDDNNYMGPAINRTARIRDAGHGGQILVADATVEIVRDQLPNGASVVDLGSHRLRDVDRTVRIWQLAHPALPHTFPPLRGVLTGRNNLPLELTSFVGRGDDVAELDALLDAERAITVTGAGGCGKTRLALHVARARLDRYAGGVWFVDFAPVNEPGAVATLVMEAVGAPASGGDSVGAIVDAIGDAPVLLVLDNCEHLVAECAGLVESLLRACASVTVMATSREPLGCEGEVAFRVPSLTAPPADLVTTDMASLGEYEAVALFLERARRTHGRNAVDTADPAVIADICRRLDGIPLALELAAARMRALTAEQIRDGLRDRFRLLTGGARTAMPRQQTLQASVDWSYALLLEPERILLQRLSVFAGGFTIEAASNVAAGGELEPHHVFDLLMQLVDKSLVFASDDGVGERRFGLLETVRQYAASKLVDSGEADAVRRRHFDYFFNFGRQRRDEPIHEFRQRVDPDYDNLRRALQWADDHDDPAPLIRMTAHLYGYWALGRRLDEGDQWLARAVARADSPALRGRVLGHFAHVHAMAVTWDDALPVAEEALELARASGNATAIVWSLAQLGNILSNVWRYDDALTVLHEAVTVAIEHGELHGRAFALFQIGRAQTIFDPTAASATLHEAIALADAADARYIRHMATACLAWANEKVGDLATAARFAEAGVAGLREIGDGWFTSGVLAFLAYIRALAHDDDGADAALAELEAVAKDIGGSVRGAVALGHGLVAFARGQWRAAATELATVPERIDRAVAWLPLVISVAQLGDPVALEEVLAVEVDAFPEYTRRMVGFARGEAAFVAGDTPAARAGFRDFFLEASPVLYGVVLDVHALRRFAATSLAVGDTDEAVRLFAASVAHAERIGVSADTGLAALTALDLSGIADDRRWAEGKAMAWHEVLAYLGRGRGARSRPTSGWDSLTPTERQVIDLVLAGQANKAIAEKLFMTVATVKSHLTHAYAKLGVRSRVELLAASPARQS